MQPYMKYKSFDHMNCSLAQTLNVIGERWTLLILRDAFFGAKRFGQFEKSLGIAKNILTSRINLLVDEGILEKRESDGRRALRIRADGKRLGSAARAARDDALGRQVQTRTNAANDWSSSSAPPANRFREMSAVSKDGRALRPRDIQAKAGPALDNKLPLRAPD